MATGEGRGAEAASRTRRRGRRRAEPTQRAQRAQCAKDGSSPRLRSALRRDGRLRRRSIPRRLARARSSRRLLLRLRPLHAGGARGGRGGGCAAAARVSLPPPPVASHLVCHRAVVCRLLLPLRGVCQYAYLFAASIGSAPNPKPRACFRAVVSATLIFYINNV